jgi:hypothetical protein
LKIGGIKICDGHVKEVHGRRPSGLLLPSEPAVPEVVFGLEAENCRDLQRSQGLEVRDLPRIRARKQVRENTMAIQGRNAM